MCMFAFICVHGMTELLLNLFFNIFYGLFFNTFANKPTFVITYAGDRSSLWRYQGSIITPMSSLFSAVGNQAQIMID